MTKWSEETVDGVAKTVEPHLTVCLPTGEIAVATEKQIKSCVRAALSAISNSKEVRELVDAVREASACLDRILKSKDWGAIEEIYCELDEALKPFTTEASDE